MKILAIDLGKRFGWCFYFGSDTTAEWGEGDYSHVLEWGDEFNKLLSKWKPDIVVLSQTNNFGHWNATRSQLIQAGIAFYLCGKRGMSGIEFNDSSARKAVFGKALKKKEVQAIYPDMKPNALDAYVLARGWHILNSKQ